MDKKPAITLRCEKLKRHPLPTGALGVCVHPDRERAFVACMDGVYGLQLESGKSERLYTHESYASGVVCLHEYDQIVSAGYDGVLLWYDLASRSVIRRIDAHGFWSWDLARAKSAPIVASASGQYLAGNYRYEPRAATEPCVRVYDGRTGDELSAHEHGPPVHSVALSEDGKLVAAGNLMGDVGVWQVAGGQRAAWNTPDFTAFGIIKSHCMVGGLYAAAFVPAGNDLVVAGMGPMRDPMAGNGKQRWQRFAWQGETPQKVAQSQDGQVGEGLMETLAFAPCGRFFVMAGRLRGGSWNCGLFDTGSGELLQSLKTDTRVTKAVFSEDGQWLLLSGADKQGSKADKQFGAVDVIQVHVQEA